MIPFVDLLIVIGLAAGGSLAVAGAGVLALRGLRRRSLIHSTMTVALVPAVAVLVGSLLTGSAMFLSAHDLSVLIVVTVVAGAVGLITAVLLARAVIAGSQALGVAAANLGEGYTGPSRALSAELAALDGKLATISRELQESRRRERSLESSRRELVAWVSHDLRTPLAGIRAMAEALEDRVAHDPGTVERYHRRIRVEADRLAGMVDDLFELSKINARALRLSLQEVPLADLVSDAVASAQPVAAAKGVRLTGHAAGSPVVQASIPELGRVLGNLLSNAIRHTPVDGVISVHARSDSQSAWVEVLDACGGIPEDDLPRLFEVAFRGTAARTPGDGGGGLGLAIARGLVEAHDGDLTIANHGPGCVARVRLPIAAGLSGTSPQAAGDGFGVASGVRGVDGAASAVGEAGGGVAGRRGQAQGR